MKLILAIVSNDDSGAVSSALTREGFSVTVIAIIGKYSSRRTQIVPSSSIHSAAPGDTGMYSSYPVEVTVGGSTIFVLNVDRFEKV